MTDLDDGVWKGLVDVVVTGFEVAVVEVEVVPPDDGRRVVLPVQQQQDLLGVSLGPSVAPAEPAKQTLGSFLSSQQ